MRALGPIENAVPDGRPMPVPVSVTWDRLRASILMSAPLPWAKIYKLPSEPTPVPFTVIVKVPEETLPATSVARICTIVVPMANRLPLAGVAKAQ